MMRHSISANVKTVLIPHIGDAGTGKGKAKEQRALANIRCVAPELTRLGVQTLDTPWSGRRFLSARRVKKKLKQLLIYMYIVA